MKGLGIAALGCIITLSACGSDGDSAPTDDNIPSTADQSNNTSIDTQSSTGQTNTDQMIDVDSAIQPFVGVQFPANALWETPCRGPTSFGLYTSLIYEFEGDRYTFSSVYYSDAGCEGAANVDTMAGGDFELLGTVPSVHGFLVYRGRFVITESNGQSIPPSSPAHRDLYVSTDDILYTSTSFRNGDLETVGGVTFSVPFLRQP